MIKHAFLSASILSAMLFSGCDNTAKLPESSGNKEASVSSKAISIGYSDYPGWVAWQIAIEKGWLKEAGVNVEFKWFDYSASLNAFSAKQIDAVTITNGDNLVIASSGMKGVMIMATDYSAGNDAIIAKPGINSIKDLKGKTIALEKGLVDHLLFNAALADAKMSVTDVTIVNAVTNELPQVFTSPDIAAVAVWQPVANQALKNVTGSKTIYSSAEKPGLIYDTISVNAEHLGQHKEEWGKIIQVWDKVVAYINDPKTHDDAVRIMANRVGINPKQYEQFISGTHFLNIADNKKVFKKEDGFESIYGSTYYVNEFNVESGIYDKKIEFENLISQEILNEL
ncbi:ABC transporter substrate-binding protein [Acinetobacter terrae]|uniref:ABC transporter substrate-binding protein n=1 Tax=Acinetobacter terrae TaxID=2731247 RepID=A0A4R0EL26_9GAMM|nr:ABC transporter substrate-binding protein [Acinetobacter terrae]TCB58199.1 ABC transporter substrate-binding protein [Acinetobacter terrae]